MVPDSGAFVRKHLLDFARNRFETAPNEREASLCYPSYIVTNITLLLGTNTALFLTRCTGLTASFSKTYTFTFIYTKYTLYSYVTLAYFMLTPF